MPTPSALARTSASLVLAATAVTGCGLGRSAGPSPARPAAPPAGRAGSGPAAQGAAPHAGHVPRPAHVVIVVMENKSRGQIVGSAQAPYLTSLAGRSADFTDARAERHPSQPNYLALFSGSTRGVTSDRCPLSFSGRNLGHELIAARLGFAGYSEGMPRDGYTGCRSGGYARKHNPWVDFTNVPASRNLRFSRFPTDYRKLPTVAFVIPGLCADMHDCPVRTGDDWLRRHLGTYATWARTHDSLLVVTWDEDDRNTATNRITTLISGQHVRPGRYGQRITHYSLLRTVEDAYGLAHLGGSADAQPITGIWRS